MDKRYLFTLIFLIVLIIAGGIYIFSTRSVSTQPLVSPTPGVIIEATMQPDEKLMIVDEKVGTGTEAIAGKKITVNYTGTLTDGTKFDSSFDHGAPFTFNLGAGEVIAGWDQGFAGMKVGGKRKLTIPSSLGYGAQGIPGAIPGNATLIFDVELLKVE